MATEKARLEEEEHERECLAEEARARVEEEQHARKEEERLTVERDLCEARGAFPGEGSMATAILAVIGFRQKSGGGGEVGVPT